MRDRFDPESPVPLYWQVAEALRYRIATGDLVPGERLPSLRAAADSWGINMHTVRRAYGELADRGIVETLPRSGTVVLNAPNGRSSSRSGGRGESPGDTEISRTQGREDLGGWLNWVAREGRRMWGLDPTEIGRALAEIRQPTRPDAPVFVIECSESQAADLARQLQDAWRLPAEPWSLERGGEPDAGAVLLATYFHYNDIRVRWPRRFPHVHFVSTRPDPAIRHRLGGPALEEEPPVPVVLWERDEAMARNIVADLLRILPEDEFAVRHEVGTWEEVPAGFGGPVLFSPRTWAELPEAERANEEFMEVRYVFEPGDLDRVAREMGWER